MDLLKKTGEDSKFRAALSNALSAAANDVLMKKVSIKKTGTKTQYLVVFKALVNLSHS